MHTRVLRRLIVFLRVRCNILILLKKLFVVALVCCSIVRCSIPHCTLFQTFTGSANHTVSTLPILITRVISWSAYVIYIIIRNGIAIYSYFTQAHTHTHICTHTYTNTCILTSFNFKYTGCPRRNVPDFRRVFLMLKYTDITQYIYIQS